MGSSILYGAINDLDLGEAKIPDYTPPGMVDKAEKTPADDNATQLTVESSARGGTKYDEQAE